MTKTIVSDAWDLPNDRDALARIAEEDPDPQRQRLAFDRVLGQLHLDTVAHIAGHDPIQWRRNAAFERLLPCINIIAQGWFHRRFSQTPAVQNMVDDAPRVIWERICRYNSEQGHFPGWCKLVLRNWAISETRSANRREYPPPSPPPPPDSDLLEAWLRRLRIMLDKIRWLPQKDKKNVHYFAVLLVQLRLRVACIVAGTPEHRDRSEFLAWCLPWRTEEEEYAFKPAWPTIMAIWDAFKEPLGQPPNYLDGAEVCLHINKLRGQEPMLTIDGWNQWVKRAKEAARKRVNDERAWQELFGWLLQDKEDDEETET